MRRRLAVLAVVPLLALMLGAGTATAAPVHQARAAHTLNVGPYRFEWHPTKFVCATYGDCWGFDMQTNGVYINGRGDINILIGGNGGGYQELRNYNTGYCLGWNDTLAEIQQQICDGGSWQFWAGTGGSPDLIWNGWFQDNHHNLCPYDGGYTQAVITAPNEGSLLNLECPLDNGFTVYDSTQKWDLY